MVTCFLPAVCGDAVDHRKLGVISVVYMYLNSHYRGIINSRPSKRLLTTRSVVSYCCMNSWTHIFVKTLCFSQKGGILSIYRDSESFKRLIYFQKCECVLLMRGILTEKLTSSSRQMVAAFRAHKPTARESGNCILRRRLFICTTLLVTSNITVNMCTGVCTCSSRL